MRVLVIFLFFVACNPIQKAHKVIAEHPDEFAADCHTFYPAKESVQVILPDSARIYEMIDSMVNMSDSSWTVLVDSLLNNHSETVVHDTVSTGIVQSTVLALKNKFRKEAYDWYKSLPSKETIRTVIDSSYSKMLLKQNQELNESLSKSTYENKMLKNRVAGKFEMIIPWYWLIAAGVLFTLLIFLKLRR